MLRLVAHGSVKTILSNATEAGYNLDPEDRFSDAPPRSLPAKLTQLLFGPIRKAISVVAIVAVRAYRTQCGQIKGIGAGADFRFGSYQRLSVLGRQ